MDALGRLLDAAEPITGDAPIPEQALRVHERRYWERLAGRFGISLDPTTLECLVAAATLWGAPSREDAQRLLDAAMRSPAIAAVTLRRSRSTRGAWPHLNS